MEINYNNKLNLLSDVFYKHRVSKDGNNLKTECPKCGKHKLEIHIEKGIYHCWVCGFRGTNLSYVVSLVNRNKVEECKRLYKRKSYKTNEFSDILNKISEMNYDTEETNIDVKLPEDFAPLILQYNSKNPDYRAIFNYALSRGVNKHKMIMMRMGCSSQYDFKRSLILPSFDKNGKLNFYVSRNIDVTSDSPYKYKNANISKKDIIFNEYLIDWNRELTIVEGPLDLIKTNDNATCLLGSALNEDFKLFQKIVDNKTDVILALDKDAYNKTLTIANLLSKYNINIKIADTRCAEDVGDMSNETFNVIKDEAKSYNLYDSLISKIRSL